MHLEEPQAQVCQAEHRSRHGTAWGGRRDIGEQEKEGRGPRHGFPTTRLASTLIAVLGAELLGMIGRTPMNAARQGADVWRNEGLGSQSWCARDEGFSPGRRELHVKMDPGGRFNAVVEPPSQQQRTGQLKSERRAGALRSPGVSRSPSGQRPVALSSATVELSVPPPPCVPG